MPHDVDSLKAFPQWSWLPLGQWAAAVCSLVGLLLFFVPDVERYPIWFRISAFLLLSLLVFIGIAAVYCYRVLSIFVGRACAFNELCAVISKTEHERDRAFETICAFMSERNEARSLKIAYCYTYESKPLIALHKKRGLRAKVGDTLAIIDSDGKSLGDFRISDISGAHYIATGSSKLDPLWLGFMIQSGTAHSAPPPGALAVLLNFTEANND